MSELGKDASDEKSRNRRAEMAKVALDNLIIQCESNWWRRHRRPTDHETRGARKPVCGMAWSISSEAGRLRLGYCLIPRLACTVSCNHLAKATEDNAQAACRIADAEEWRSRFEYGATIHDATMFTERTKHA